MRIEEISSGSGAILPEGGTARFGNTSGVFARTLGEKLRKNHVSSPASSTLVQEMAGRNETTEQTHLVSLGKLTKNIPTVSALLRRHPRFSSECWKIVHDEKNQAKPFTRILPGSEIFLDITTNELVWKHENHALADHETLHENAHAAGQAAWNAVEERSGMATKFGNDVRSPVPINSSLQNEPIFLGVIGEDNPTISHLLRNHPEFRDFSWKIIHAQANDGKPYRRIVPGSEIFINPLTNELSWDIRSTAKHDVHGPSHAVMSGVRHDEAESFAAEDNSASGNNLADAALPYMGRKYSEIDCYELVVRTLGEMGVRYEGKGGLLDRLVTMAAEKGLPANSFLNGEGLIEAAGARVYSCSYGNLGKSWQARANEVVQALEPTLEKGMILSFSTRSKGHTGIVSRQGGQWTYINSGRMDHKVTPGPNGKGVGEEELSKEINNWFRLAAKLGESLKITLGRFDQDKIRTAMRPGPESNRKIL